MPQISLYIDEPTLKKIEQAAAKERLSISKWVAKQLRAQVEAVYPPQYEELFGSVTDDSFCRPPEPAFNSDSPRSDF